MSLSTLKKKNNLIGESPEKGNDEVCFKGRFTATADPCTLISVFPACIYIHDVKITGT